ncbi:MAG: hypothetical protein OZSIB_0267 [Candidatus Ozemobacter sibiricus]|jgi:hypothetical protein|uniref:Putative zinc-finger domain-containing protein n=1 Tax=Candidatus Ozemobacter sibiricus TaxID=2268124 RepID=A0A367ZM18_9BACT|nr:MAG: hypothetical protein OZSIB_0267 [Candidatus Ozemobacter sibiricus]
MTCNREETAYAFLDGELGPREAAEFAQHLAGCSECKILVHETQERERSLRAVLTHLASSCQIAGKVMRRLPAEKILPAPHAGRSADGGTSILFGWRYLVPSGLTIVVLAWLLSQSPAPLPAPLHHQAVEGITLSALGPEARLDGVILPADRPQSILPGKLLQVVGPVAIQFPGAREPGLTLHGQAQFTLAPGALQWQSGAATLEVAPRRPPLTITWNGHRLLLGEGTLSIAGSPAEGMQILLKRGRGWLRGPQGAGELSPGKPLTLSAPPPSTSSVPAPGEPPPEPSSGPPTIESPTPARLMTSGQPAALATDALRPGNRPRTATPTILLATDTPASDTNPDQVEPNPPAVTGPSGHPFGDDPVVLSH